MKSATASLWHLTGTSADGLNLFSGEAATRKVVQILVDYGKDDLLSFNVVDTHLHEQLAAMADSLGNRKRALTLALTPHFETHFGGWHVQPVETGRHARSLVAYHVKQSSKHGLTIHPALWSGSSFQDFVGARWLPGFNRKRLFEVHRRLRLREMLGMVGLPERPVLPLDDSALSQLGARRLVEAASAAACAHPDYEGNGAAVVTARTVASVLGAAAGFSAMGLAAAMDASSRTIQRLARRNVDPRYLQATRVRLALEEAVAVASAGALVAVSG